MTFKEACKTKKGDKVIANGNGESRSVKYEAGEVGEVAYKEGLSFFAVKLDRGEETGIVLQQNWDLLK